ncbi:MAG: ArsA family ATPase [Bdellovibrionaceae bacterium]|nr:ArsA family ATPase [Pseudobdellovibrionaceae bacterium]
MSFIARDVRVVVCAGTGGVGKTTIAAALAAQAAEEGRRVLVLTIDPSQRLKTTLGLSDSGETSELKHPRIKGSLSAAVVNSKKTFDDFVLRSARSKESAQRILNNKLYVQLSTTLSGSQEFTALERLYEAVESGNYDLVILDTPPAKHAMDFLKAPQKLGALFQDKITRWFRDPKGGDKSFLVGIFQMGTKQVIKALEKLTGSEFVRELSDFFSSIQSWQGELEERTNNVHRLLVAASTQFVLVCSYDRSKLLEAFKFAKAIRQDGYHLHSLILNRAFPEWLANRQDRTFPSDPAGQMAAKWAGYFEERRKNSSILSELQNQSVQIRELPEMKEDIRTLDGVFEIVDRLKEQT